jgi:AGZA family xanthine/uracil permease-like MFS transporter
MTERLKRFFEIDSRSSSIATEVLAGLSTFLALSYIFVVNPAILSQAGMSASAVLFTTIITSATATILMGAWARLPFVLAPGMEMNAYVTFFVVGALGFTWQQALGAVFWSGIIFLVLTLTHVRQHIIEAIPEQMKSALSLSVGVFLALVALKIAGLLRYEGVHFVGFGSPLTLDTAAFCLSLVLAVGLDKLRLRGAVIISILATTAFCILLGHGATKAAGMTTTAMFSGMAKLEPRVLFCPRMLSVILILFLIDFYGSVAKLIGLSITTNLMSTGRLPRLREALLVDSTATIAGALLGTSSLTVYVESGVGISAGGRTGLAAVTAGALMLACFSLTPFLSIVPLVATTGALILVAIKLIPPIARLQQFSRTDAVATILMQVAVIATFSIDRAMLLGFGIYLLTTLLQRRRPNPYLVASTCALALGFVLQIT